jgi:Leucine-rich repeat (LRR) protein
MKRKQFSLIIVLLLAFLVAGFLLFRCSINNPELKIVTVNGAGQIFNYTRNNMNFGSISDSGELTALAVSEGDILYVWGNESSNPYIIQYHESDGLNLSVSSDTVDFNGFYLNGKLNALYYGNKYKRAEGKDIETLKGLRSIVMEGDSIPDLLTTLSEIAETNPFVGLEFIDFNDREQFNQIISLFKPDWIVVSGILLSDIKETRLANLKSLEDLIIVDADSLHNDVLNKLPGLRSLIIGDWTLPESLVTNFKGIKNLRSISIFEADVKSISELNLPKNLTSLYMVKCSLTDISQIRELTRLKNLSLEGCDTLSDISVLNEIPSLQWLALPPKVSQESFNKIIKHHRSLQALELVGCKEISDLSALKQLNELKALTLDLPAIDFETLEQLTNIKLIIIKQSQFDESEVKINELKEALPDTYIVPGGGICMGSGWILIVIPVFFLVILIRMLIRRYYA